jgi:hypothetical protein
MVSVTNVHTQSVCTSDVHAALCPVGEGGCCVCDGKCSLECEGGLCWCSHNGRNVSSTSCARLFSRFTARSAHGPTTLVWFSPNPPPHPAPHASLPPSSLLPPCDPFCRSEQAGQHTVHIRDGTAAAARQLPQRRQQQQHHRECPAPWYRAH